MFTLLHLSDLHFGTDHAFAQKKNPQGLSGLGAAIQRVLSDNLVKIDHVVFTGDFFTRDQFKDRTQAEKGIKSLQSALGLTNDQLSFLPGNHDLTWDEDIEDRFISYDELVRAFGRDDCGQANLPVVKQLNAPDSARPILLALLNSCTVEGKALAGIGNIGEEQLDRLKAGMQSKVQPAQEYVLIAALHHHLLPIYPIEKIEDADWPTDAPKGRSSHTLDAVDVLNELSALNTALIIHGHQHRPAVISYHDRLHESRPLTIAASGSCASKHDERQFFVYEIGHDEITVRSFTQPKSDTRFSPFKAPLTIPLPHISQFSNQYCLEEAKVRHHVVTTSDVSGEDVSDLHLFFMSVKSCAESREIVREFVKTLPPNICTLNGMYDLLGKWDLLVRLRFSQKAPAVLFREFKDNLHQKLITGLQMEKSGPFFTDYKHIDVLREARSLSELLEKPVAPVAAIRRRVLDDPQAYDRQRCQRGLLYIKLPDERNSKTRMIGDLDTELKKDPIIEAIYRGENELVIETFMTCAQSTALNHLNRKIEKTLSEFGSQKYTMFCYGYDELEITAKQ
ncbi:MAG TPA: metallophosphoesterase [Pyrinomonadaceae bacterium]|nr:metallophosphoesterase [Pyrinomonadaceae bacterium]